MPWLDLLKSNLSLRRVLLEPACFKNGPCTADRLRLCFVLDQKKLINARGGLYNRITQRIKLIPFTLVKRVVHFKPWGKPATIQNLELYMAMVGIPFYLKRNRKSKVRPD